tara:strand:- start:20579 stop:21520 length:942 start_codon:yes stop_codon:yes gene_type:complete
MNFKSSICYLAIFSFAFISCGDDPKEENNLVEATTKLKAEATMDCPAYITKNKPNNLNISILLDLSDRIEQPKSIEKDVAYLGSLAKAFTNHIKTKKLVLLEDRIQLFFNPEPSSSKINEIAENLKISFTKDTPKELIDETQTLYQTEPIKLYEFAKTDANGIKENYPGSDIWRFFKDNVRDYSMDNCHRNILVILTDGYMYYDKTEMKEGGRTSYLTPKYLSKLNLKKSNWKEEMQKQDLGFIPAAKDLQDLEVLVIGINSLNDDNPYTLDIIQEYWSQWFREMGIPEGNYKIKNAVIPSNMEGVILDFINK